MVLALVFLGQWSNILVVFLSLVVLVSLIRWINFKDKVWLSGFVAVILVALISVLQIFAYNNLADQLSDKEVALETMSNNYTKLKSASDEARATYDDVRKNVHTSKSELDDLQRKVNAEFERTVAEIKRIYADISDEELDRRVNAIVRKANRNLQNNVFK
jgi:peptidoglycan hydrolase CwlO-like protein